MLATADSTPPIARISILGSESIIVGSNISDCIARELRDVVPVSCYVILTDSNVEKLHLKRLADGIRTSCGNAQILTIVLRPGESSKSRNVKAFVEDAMLSGGCTRNSCVIALGGGVVGDLGGAFSHRLYLHKAKALSVSRFCGGDFYAWRCFYPSPNYASGHG